MALKEPSLQQVEEPESDVDWDIVAGFEAVHVAKECAVSMIVRAIIDIVSMRKAKERLAPGAAKDYAAEYKIRDGEDAVLWLTETARGRMTFSDCCDFLGYESPKEIAQRILDDPEGVLARLKNSGEGRNTPVMVEVSSGDVMAEILREQPDAPGILSGMFSMDGSEEPSIHESDGFARPQPY